MNYFPAAKLADSSIKLFNSHINKWLELMPVKDIQYIIMFPLHALDILHTYLKQNDIDNPLNKKKSFNTTNIHLYISSIIAAMKHSSQLLPLIPQMHTYYTLWLDICDNNSKQIVKKRYDHTPTDIQITKGAYNITYNDLCNKRYDENTNITDKLLLAMYTDIYPVRADYYALGIIREGETPFTDNYIIIKTTSAELILNKFKTSHIYGKIHYPILPDTLYKLIIESLDIEPRKYLFHKNNGPYTPNKFCVWANSRLRALFDMDITLTFIRHLFLNTIDTNNTPASELKRINFAEMAVRGVLKFGFKGFSRWLCIIILIGRNPFMHYMVV